MGIPVEDKSGVQKNGGLTESFGTQNSSNESEISSTSNKPSEGIPLCPLWDTIPDTTDVVIIGADPAGLTLACELARRRINFIILDINSRPLVHSRTCMLNARSLEVFADLGVAEAAVLAGQIARGTRIIINNKPALDLKFGGIASPFPFALMIEQFQVENILIDHLEDLGHRVYRPVAAWKIEIPAVKDPDGLQWMGDSKVNDASIYLAAHSALAMRGPGLTSESTVSLGASVVGGVIPGLLPMDSTLRTLQSFVDDPYCTVQIKPLDACGRPVQCGNDSPYDKSMQIRCRYIVGSDGERSNVRKAIQIPLVSRGPTADFVIADISVVWGTTLATDRMHVLQNASGVLVALPMTEGRWRMICMRRSPIDVHDDNELITNLPAPDFLELQQILSAIVPETLLEGVYWRETFAVNSKIAESFRKSSALVIGDAAHAHPPTFCQSMNNGIQDAYNLGWKLSAVVRGASGKLLESYSTERRDAAEEIARQSNRVFEMLLNNGVALRWFITSLAPVISSLDFFANNFSSNISNVDIKYPQSQIIGPNFLARGGIEPGSRVSNATMVTVPLVTDGFSALEIDRGLLNYLHGGQHTLLLCVHVLPPGTKVRTMFGCERNVEAVRWSVKCLERLARLGRLLVESFKGRETEISYGGLRVLWVLCGLVNVKSSKNSVGLGQIKDHVPHRLKYFFIYASKIASRCCIAVDYEGEVHKMLGLRLADPDGCNGEEKSGAFVLIRPDGYACCNGYAGDTAAISSAFDYAISWCSD